MLLSLGISSDFKKFLRAASAASVAFLMSSGVAPAFIKTASNPIKVFANAHNVEPKIPSRKY